MTISGTDASTTASSKSSPEGTVATLAIREEVSSSSQRAGGKEGATQ